MSVEFSYQMREQDFEQAHDDEFSDANITNQSSHENSVSEEISETDSSLNEQNIEIKSETFDNEQPAAPAPTAYQQNCLAAAQMMQLLYAKSGSSSASSTTSNQDLTTQQVSPSGENEKENIPVCKYCSKVFANFSNLNHHVSAIHLNQSKWVCSQCGKICSSKSNLKVHLRVHLRVKPYHCRWCSYSCMHHSSIRDHLAKLHPDKTHTPLQPGYLFNSQAVPEPEVFNAKGFNVNSFVSDSKMKRESSPTRDRSPEKQRQYKKARLSNEQQPKRHSPEVQQRPVQSYNPLQSPPLNQMYQQMQQSSSKANFPTSQAFNSQNGTNISNLYNAYNMARMLPFMYNPAMQMQYSNTQQSSPSANYLSMLNQNMIQMQNRSHQLEMNSGFTSNNNNQSSSSDDHATSSSSNFSYSNSSRSSSLSPEVKAESVKQSHDDSLTYSVKVESNLPITPIRTNPKKILSVDQMLGINTKKQTREIETQTDDSCLRCSNCNHSV